MLRGTAPQFSLSSQLPKVSEANLLQGAVLPEHVCTNQLQRTHQLKDIQQLFSESICSSPRFVRLHARERRQGFHGEPGTRAWGKGLEQDICCVVAEAGLPPAAATAVLAAAKKGALPSNPGVLLQQLVAFASLEDELPRRVLARIVCASPMVIKQDAVQSRWNVQFLATVFSTPQLQAALPLHPGLLSVSPFTLWSNLEELRCILDTSLEQTIELAAKRPRLLNMSTSRLRHRFEELVTASGLQAWQLARLVTRQPNLLDCDSSTLLENIQALARTLQLTSTRIGALALSAPTVLMLHPDGVIAKLEGLGQVLGLARSEVLRLVKAQPSILTLSTDTARVKFRVLSSVLAVEGREAVGVLLSCPALLTISSEALQQKMDRLMDLACLAPNWQAQVKKASPKTLANWLCFSTTRLDRLRTIADMGKCTEHSMSKLLKISNRQYCALVYNADT